MICSIASPSVRHVMSRSMTKDAFEMDDKSSAISDEMAERVRIAALPIRASDSVKTRIVRASLRLGLAYQRTRALWYRAARRIEAHEADLIRARTAHLAELQHRMKAIDALLEGVDESPDQLSLDLDGGAAHARRALADAEG